MRWVRVSLLKQNGNLSRRWYSASVCGADLRRMNVFPGDNVALKFGQPVFRRVEPGTVSGHGMQGPA